MPGSMLRPNMTGKDVSSGQGPISVTSSHQGTQGQSGSGAITLPGGTITVTPLTPLSLVGVPTSLAIPAFTGRPTSTMRHNSTL